MRRRHIILSTVLLLALSTALFACESAGNNEISRETSGTVKEQTTQQENKTADTETEAVNPGQSPEVHKPNTQAAQAITDIAVNNPNDVLNGFKELAERISTQYEAPDMLFGICMSGGKCYLTFYHEDELRCVSEQDGYLVEEEASEANFLTPYMTAETISQLPVFICENQMGWTSLEGALSYDFSSEQTTEDFNDEVSDGIYYGTIIGINIDGTEVLVSIGTPYIDENGEVYFEGGQGTYYFTDERFFQILPLADDLRVCDYFTLRTDGFPDCETSEEYIDYLSYTVGSDKMPSIFSAPFMNFYPQMGGNYCEIGAYDGWTAVCCQVNPIEIENGVVTNITIEPQVSDYYER